MHHQLYELPKPIQILNADPCSFSMMALFDFSRYSSFDLLYWKFGQIFSSPQPCLGEVSSAISATIDNYMTHLL